MRWETEDGTTEDGRQKMGDRKWETEDGRQKMGDRRWETEDGRQEMGDRRCETGDARQETRNRRHETGDGTQRRRETEDEILETGQDTVDRTVVLETENRRQEMGWLTGDKTGDRRQDIGTGDSRLCTKMGLGDGG